MFLVKISDDCLESMVLAAVEAYCLGDSTPNLSKLETLAYIWGYQKRARDGNTVYHVTKMSLSLSAKRANDSVEPHERAAALKNSVVERWSPHLTLLGDFHTHPENDRGEVERDKLFEFSDQDIDSFLEDDFVWNEAGNLPLMLVMTICRLRRVRESWGGEMLRNNVWRFDVGEFRIWLNAAAGYVEGGERKWTGNTRSPLVLDLNSRFFNESGDRIDEQLRR